MAAKKKKTTKSPVKAKAKAKAKVVAKAKATPKAKVKAKAKAKANTKVTAKAKAKPATKAAAPVEKAGEFPSVLKRLEEIVNGGQAGEMDFEMYQSFNEQYKPSDWTSNPKSDEDLWTFGMDGSGGQVALWRHEPSAKLEDRPVVMLGSEGEVSPIATDLPSFLYLVANGVGPMEVLFDMVNWDDLQASDEILAWVREEWPDRKFPAPKKIVTDAKSKLKHFEKHVLSQRPEL